MRTFPRALEGEAGAGALTRELFSSNIILIPPNPARGERGAVRHGPGRGRWAGRAYCSSPTQQTMRDGYLALLSLNLVHYQMRFQK